MIKRILICVFGILLAFVLPLNILKIIVNDYLTYSSVNITIVYAITLAHIDFIIFLVYYIIKNSTKKP